MECTYYFVLIFFYFRVKYSDPTTKIIRKLRINVVFEK